VVLGQWHFRYNVHELHGQFGNLNSGAQAEPGEAMISGYVSRKKL
jgi:hypothetical protein